MRSADPKSISRGITVLSNSQSYVKSFDGMAYELKGKIKDGGSTADIDAVSGGRGETGARRSDDRLPLTGGLNREGHTMSLPCCICCLMLARACYCMHGSCTAMFRQ